MYQKDLAGAARRCVVVYTQLAPYRFADHFIRVFEHGEYGDRGAGRSQNGPAVGAYIINVRDDRCVLGVTYHVVPDGLQSGLRNGKGHAGKIALNFLAALYQRGLCGIFDRIGVEPLGPDGPSMSGVDVHFESVRAEFFKQRYGAGGEVVGIVLPVTAVDRIKRLFIGVGVDVIVRACYKALRDGGAIRIPGRDAAVSIAGHLCPGGCQLLAKLRRLIRCDCREDRCGGKNRKADGCQGVSYRHY